MNKAQSLSTRVSANTRRAAPEPQELPDLETEILERWGSRVDDARKLVADQIVYSVRAKWGTAVALEAATGICQTEISRIRHGKFDRFSLERLVRLLCTVDPDVEVQLKVKVVLKGEG